MTREKSLLFIATLLAMNFAYAQQPIGNHYPNMVRTEQSIRTPDDDCSQSNPSNNFEFFGAVASDDQMVASDIFVPADEIFTLEQIIVNFNSEQGNSRVDINIWSSENDLPSSLLFFESSTPTAQNAIGTDPITNFSVFETILDLFTTFEMQGGSSGTRYWVQLKPLPISTSQPLAGWEHTSATQVGLPIAFTNKAGEWMLGSTLDGVYIFNGDCQTLDTEDNALNSLEIYPNPADSEITIATRFEINSSDIKVYTLQGKEVVVPFNNSQLDVSTLASGMYLLRIENKRNSITKKIVVN